MNNSELYFSVDIETNGPCPGINSMLSFGCVALTKDGVEVDCFQVNLDLLPGSKSDPDTMEFWARNAKAYKECRRNTQDPKKVIPYFCHWVDKFKDKGWRPVMVCYPAGFDFTFMYYYMMKFAGFSPFSFSAIDVKSYACAVLKRPYRKSNKRYWPEEWFADLPHTHVAIDDAREQGQTFINMMKYNTEK